MDVASEEQIYMSQSIRFLTDFNDMSGVLLDLKNVINIELSSGLLSMHLLLEFADF